MVLREWLKMQKRPVAGLKIAIEGFGRLGSVAAAMLHAQGAVVVAATDSFGGVRRDQGLDVPALIAYSRAQGTVAGFPDTDPVDPRTLITLPVDVLIPASTGRIISRSNAGDVQAELVIEGANGPCTPTADEILQKRGITLLPDVLCNAGGVIISYFEWVQGRNEFFWSEDEVNGKLEDVIVRAFHNVQKEAADKRLTYRSAAWLLGVGRVAKAFELRGLYP
jgi:glutamate dehydrogenase/leucine dehydrogenase